LPVRRASFQRGIVDGGTLHRLPSGGFGGRILNESWRPVADSELIKTAEASGGTMAGDRRKRRGVVKTTDGAHQGKGSAASGSYAESHTARSAVAKRRTKTTAGAPVPDAASYTHPGAESPMRPDVGTQAQFRKKKAPRTYRYDSSLAPELQWDGENGAREQGEALIRRILDATSIEEAKGAARELERLGRPFLNWTGKAERLSFDVPTLPLFIHERLSTKAILETLKSHRRDQQVELSLFADPQHSITDQVLRAYEHRDKWVNRMVLGDSLVVMNSLLEYEGMGGQVQMIYIDPPYGVKFGSNFQPFVRKRDVKHNDDGDMTREHSRRSACPLVGPVT
jgi:16S rRNA G966 N2-methylase RsmD